MFILFRFTKYFVEPFDCRCSSSLIRVSMRGGINVTRWHNYMLKIKWSQKWMTTKNESLLFAQKSVHIGKSEFCFVSGVCIKLKLTDVECKTHKNKGLSFQTCFQLTFFFGFLFLSFFKIAFSFLSLVSFVIPHLPFYSFINWQLFLKHYR